MNAPRPLLRPWLGGILLVVGCLFIYRESLSFGFVMFDDDVNFLFNQDFGPLDLARLKWLATEHEIMMRYVPLGWLVYCAIASINGLDPFWFHLASVALQAASCVALYSVLVRLAAVLDRQNQHPSRLLGLLAVALAACWGWHPLRVETVAWVTTLIYLVATLFGLGSLWCFLRALDSPQPKRGLLVVSGLCFIAALLSHPAALAFFPLLAACAVLCLPGRQGMHLGLPGLRQLGKLLLPFLAAGVLSAGATLAVRQLGSVVPHGPAVSLAEFSISQRLAQASAVITHFGSKTLWPTNLSPSYPLLETVQPNTPAFLLAIAVSLGLVILCDLALRQAPLAGLFAFATLAACAPFLGLTEHPFFPCDRYTHIPMIGLVIFGLVAVAESNWVRHVASWALPAVLVIVLPLCLLASARQVRLWSSDETLFAGLSAAQTSGRSRDFYATRLLQISLNRGDLAAAQLQLDRMVAQGLSPARQGELAAMIQATSEPALCATLLLMQAHYATTQGHTQDAIDRLRRAIGISPQYDQARYILGMLLAREGDARGALAQLLVLRGRANPIPSETLNKLGDSVAQAFRGRQGSMFQLTRHPNWRDRLRVSTQQRRVGGPRDDLHRDTFSLELERDVALARNLGDKVRGDALALQKIQR